MSFSVMVPVAAVDAANAALEAAGYGSNNFAVPLRPAGAGIGQSGTHAALYHLGNDAAFQAQCAALPGAVVTAAPQMTVAIQAHVATQSLEWTDPANWFLAPVMLGAQRTHAGKLWESLVDYNVWTPPVAWREVVAEGYPAWVQPTGAHDAYPLGFKVTFNGQNWENTGSAANVWQPGVFGWVVIA